MQIDTDYHHIQVSPALNAFIEKKLHTLMRRFHMWNDAMRIKIHIDRENRRKTGSAKVFSVTATLIRPRAKTLVATKQGSDVRKIVSAAIEALETMARRDAKMREHSRKTLGRSRKPVKQAIWEMSRERSTEH